MNKESIRQKMFHERLWKIFNFFRGSLLTESVVSLFLQLLFYKFLEDNHKNIQIGQRYVQLNFPDEYRLANLISTNMETDLPRRLGDAFLKIEEFNDPLLQGIFMQSDLSYFNRNSDQNVGKGLLELVSFINTLNTDQKCLKEDDLVFSELFGSLLDSLAETELRRSGSFLVPKSLRELLAGLNSIAAEPAETVYDPAGGNGALLMEVVQQSYASATAFAQERNMTALSMAKMQWIINGQDPDNVAIGDALNHPHFIQQGHLQQFDKVISCPPFGMSGWGADRAATDRYQRYNWGIPPASRADYAYILHSIASLKPKGSAFLVSIAGVLFRGGAEEQIRKNLIDHNLISAIIALPAGLFNFWNVPLCILCLNKAEKRRQPGLLMVDLASFPNQLRNKEGLNTATVNQVVESVKRFITQQEVAVQDEVFSKIITIAEIVANDYNLNMARYFAPGDKTPAIDHQKLSREIVRIESELTELDIKIDGLKKQLKLY